VLNFIYNGVLSELFYFCQVFMGHHIMKKTLSVLVCHPLCPSASGSRNNSENTGRSLKLWQPFEDECDLFRTKYDQNPLE
jgi:hypothetical protein